MRARSIALPFVAALFACSAFACSGAKETELYASGDGRQDDTVTEAPNPTLPVTPSGSANGNGNGADPTGPAPTQPTGPTPTNPTPPENTCVVEAEPNDTAQQANAITTCFTGKIDKRGDVDDATVTVPAGARTVSWTIKSDGADPSVRITGGGLVNIFPIPNGGAVQPGDKLLVQVSVNGNGKPAYELRLVFQ